jgi:hypothetical protein
MLLLACLGALCGQLGCLLHVVEVLPKRVHSIVSMLCRSRCSYCIYLLLLFSAEAARYFTDALLTLQAFVQCLPAAAALLLHPANHGSLLLALAVVHSSVLPQLLRLAQQPGAAEASGNGLTPSRVLQLQQCLVSLVFHLLTSAFCTAAGAAASGGPDAVAAAAAKGSSSSNGSNSSSSSSSFNPEVQGQELMNLLMLLAHPSDHVHQQQDGAAADFGLKGSLLAVMNELHHFDVAVAAAMQQVNRRWVSSLWRSSS